MDRFLAFLQHIDRRWIYLVLAVSLITSLILGKTVTPVVMPPVQQLYDAVEAAPAGPDDGNIILLGLTFSPSSKAESGNQARAMLRHMMLAKKRFAIISVGEPQGAIIGTALVQDVAKQYGYEYGKDWISFGFKLSTTAFYTGFPRDIPGAVIKDGIEGKPIADFPIMHGVKTIKDVPLFIDVSASNSVFSWVTMVQQRYPLKIGYACTGVMAAEAYPFLDSGQITGMLPGLKGAADYELLVDEREASTLDRGSASGVKHAGYDYDAPANVAISPARKLMFTQGTAHLVIIIFIIIGNLGLLLANLRAKTASKEGA